MRRGTVGSRGCLLVGGLRRGIAGVLRVERGDEGFVMPGGGFPVEMSVTQRGLRETYDRKSYAQSIEPIICKSRDPPPCSFQIFVCALPSINRRTRCIPLIRHRDNIYLISTPTLPSKTPNSPKTPLTSSTLLAKTPTQSNESAYDTTPYRLTVPYPGFNPTIPQYAAGSLTLPPVSVPNAAKTSPDATAAALPPELPPADLSSPGPGKGLTTLEA